MPAAEGLIQAAGAVPLQIERYVVIADPRELAKDRRAHGRLERVSHLVLGDFEPRHGLVMADTADPKTQLAEHVLRPLDHAQLLGRHLVAVWDARRQAR